MSGRKMGQVGYIAPSGTIPYRPSILYIYKVPMPLSAHTIRSISQAVQKLSSGKENETLGCCDLDLDPMTFTSELDVDMVVTYLHAKI